MIILEYGREMLVTGTMNHFWYHDFSEKTKPHSDIRGMPKLATRSSWYSGCTRRGNDTCWKQRVLTSWLPILFPLFGEICFQYFGIMRATKVDAPIPYNYTPKESLSVTFILSERFSLRCFLSPLLAKWLANEPQNQHDEREYNLENNR